MISDISLSDNSLYSLMQRIFVFVAVFGILIFVVKTIVKKLNQSLVNNFIIVVKLEALSSVSAYSFEASESVTIPPPA